MNLSDSQIGLVARVCRRPGKTAGAYKASREQLDRLCKPDGPLYREPITQWGLPRRYRPRPKTAEGYRAAERMKQIQAELAKKRAEQEKASATKAQAPT